MAIVLNLSVLEVGVSSITIKVINVPFMVIAKVMDTLIINKQKKS